MSRSLERDPDGVAGALAMHLGLYCAVAACFALILYYLMQPARLPNPGMVAHKVSPRTVNYVELLRSEQETFKRDVRVELEPETTGAAIGPVTKPEAKKVKASTRQSRTRPTSQPNPIEGTSYAVEPSFDAYRPMY